MGIEQYDKNVSTLIFMEKIMCSTLAGLEPANLVLKTDALSTHNVKLAAIFVSLHCTLYSLFLPLKDTPIQFHVDLCHKAFTNLQQFF